MITNCATIKLAVTNDQLTIVRNYDATTNTVGAVCIYFDFKTEDWSNLEKTVVFFKDGLITPIVQVLGSETSCEVPFQIFQCNDTSKQFITYEVGIWGTNGSDRLPTNRVKLKMNRSCYCQGETPVSPTPSVYEQLVAQIANLNNLSLEDVSTEILEYCTNADFASKDYVNDAISNIDMSLIIETDPTVPAWAKQPAKPSYTAQEVGALPNNTVIPPAYNDAEVRNLIANEVNARIVADGGKANAEHTHENYLTEHQSLEGYATEEFVEDAIASIPTPDISGQIALHNTSGTAHSDIRAVTPTKVSDLANDSGYLTEHQSLDGYATESYVDTAIDAIPTPDISGQISVHNSNEAAHSDIRTLISGIVTRLNALANSDDTTLDQLSEVVAYIKSNRSLIESITTNKVNVSDIINTLDSTDVTKPLSAAQGKVLNDLIIALSSVDTGPIILNLGYTDDIPHTFTSQEAQTLYEQLASVTDSNDKINAQILCNITPFGFVGVNFNYYLVGNVVVARTVGPNTYPDYTATFFNTNTIDFCYYVLTVSRTSDTYSAVLEDVPIRVSSFTNDSEYLTEHQDISGKINKSGGISYNGQSLIAVGDVVPIEPDKIYFTTPETIESVSTITLESNHKYVLTLSDNVQIVFPTIVNIVYDNSIVIYLTCTADIDIAFPVNTEFYGGSAPDTSAGEHTLIFDYNPNTSKWRVGGLTSEVVS